MIFWIGEDRKGFSESLIAQRNLVCGREEDRKTKTKSDPGKVALMVLMVGMTGFEPAPPAPESFGRTFNAFLPRTGSRTL